MNNSTFNSSALNATAGGGVKSAKFSIDARIAMQNSVVFSADALLQGKYSVNFGVDAVLQGGSTLFFSVDAVLATPFKDLGAFHRTIGDGLTIPIDPNKLSQWSTYTRPANPIVNQTGINKQTGKIEYWDGSAWKNYDNSNA